MTVLPSRHADEDGDFGELLLIRTFFNFSAGLQHLRSAFSIQHSPAIPNNRLDSSGEHHHQRLLSKIAARPRGIGDLQRCPTPTQPGVFHNYDASIVVPKDSNQWTIKTDFILTNRQRLTGQFRPPRQRPLGRNRAGTAASFHQPGHLACRCFGRISSGLSMITHLSANILNHFNFGWSLLNVSNQNTAFGFNTSTLGIPANAYSKRRVPANRFPRLRWS